MAARDALDDLNPPFKVGVYKATRDLLIHPYQSHENPTDSDFACMLPLPGQRCGGGLPQVRGQIRCTPTVRR
jgi:hypothetical protein